MRYGRGYVKPPPGRQLALGHPQAQSIALDLPFNEGDGVRANDLSGNGNHGEITGPVWDQGRVGHALLFNQGGAQVNVPNKSSLQFADGEDITIAAWVNLADAASGTTNVILAKHPVDLQINYAIRRFVASGEFDFVYGDGGEWHVWRTTSAYAQTQEWVHWAVTYTFGTGASIIVYRNGLPVAGSWVAGTGNDAPNVGTGDLEIGDITVSGWTDREWLGSMESVLIYRRYLGQGEIRQLYSEPYARFRGR